MKWQKKDPSLYVYDIYVIHNKIRNEYKNSKTLLRVYI